MPKERDKVCCGGSDKSYFQNMYIMHCRLGVTPTMLKSFFRALTGIDYTIKKQNKQRTAVRVFIKKYKILQGVTKYA